jgi:hypothetical protein
MGENHRMISYISKNTFIGSTNFPILQHQLEGGYNPLFTKGSNLKEDTTPYNYLAPTRRRSLYNPPILSGSNLKEAPTPCNSHCTTNHCTKGGYNPPFPVTDTQH